MAFCAARSLTARDSVVVVTCSMRSMVAPPGRSSSWRRGLSSVSSWLVWIEPMDRPDAFRDRLAGVLDPPTLSPEMEGLPVDTSLAAVLVPVLTASPEPRLVFTRRTDSLSRHAGEISFPGGLADADEDLP